MVRTLRTALLALLIAFSFTNSFAQEFPTHGAKWTYPWGKSFSWDYSYTKFECLGDTLINGTDTCKHVIQQYVHPQFVYTDLDLTHMIYKKNNGILYHWNASLSKFDLIMDFNKAVGDSFLMDVDSCQYWVKVFNVTQETYNSTVTNTHHYSNSNGPNGSFNDHIGFLPPDRTSCSNLVACGIIFSPICYYEDSIVGVWQKNGTSNCELESVSVEEHETPQFSISPNPASEAIELVPHNSGSVYSLSIFDIAGKLMIEVKEKTGSRSIAINDLTPGNYFLRFEVDGTVSTKRLGITR